MDFLETLFGFSPDGGNGSFELLMFLPLSLGSRQRRRIECVGHVSEPGNGRRLSRHGGLQPYLATYHPCGTPTPVPLLDRNLLHRSATGANRISQIGKALQWFALGVAVALLGSVASSHARDLPRSVLPSLEPESVHVWVDVDLPTLARRSTCANRARQPLHRCPRGIEPRAN